MGRGVIRKITLITNFWLNIYYCWQPVARSPHARNPHARSPHVRKIAIPEKTWPEIQRLARCLNWNTVMHSGI